MGKSIPISVRLDPGLHSQLVKLAAGFDRPKSWVIEQAVRDYVALQSWQFAAIEEGIRAADAGQVVAHEEVLAWVQSWDAPEEQPVPECKYPECG